MTQEFSVPYVNDGRAFTLSRATLTPAILEAGIAAKRLALRRNSEGLDGIAPEFRDECLKEARSAGMAAQAAAYLYGCLARIDVRLPRSYASPEALLAVMDLGDFTAMLTAIGGKEAPDGVDPFAATTPMAST